jgi:hypothetical protein
VPFIFVSLLCGELHADAGLRFGGFGGANDQIALLNQPMVKLISGVDAAILADASDLFIFLGVRRGSIQQDLHGTGQIFAEFAPLVFYVSFWRHGLSPLGCVMRFSHAAGDVPTRMLHKL